MRVVGGEFRGRALAAPTGLDIRPTTDRTRESLFNVLAHAFPANLSGARVLDLFAGTGALGVEALSRGANFCLFVDNSAESRALVRSNIENLNLQGRAKLFRRDAANLGEAGAAGRFDLVFADPPYGKGLGEKALASALAGGWLASDALCVVEEAVGARFDAGPGFDLVDERAYGDTTLRFLRPRSRN